MAFDRLRQVGPCRFLAFSAPPPLYLDLRAGARENEYAGRLCLWPNACAAASAFLRRPEFTDEVILHE